MIRAGIWCQDADLALAAMSQADIVSCVRTMLGMVKTTRDGLPESSIHQLIHRGPALTKAQLEEQALQENGNNAGAEVKI